MGRFSLDKERFYEKVTRLTFFFSLLVVLIHGYNIPLFLGENGYQGLGLVVYHIEYFIAEVLGPIAVPGFFMLSAYLFYRNFSWDQLGRKWTSRIKSILVPYIVWNALYYFGYVVFRRVPALEGIVGSGEVPLSLANLADAIMNFTYNPVFWYLYQLILLIALAPVIYCLLFNKYLGIVALAAMGTAIHYHIYFPYLNMDALFYYSAAAFMALHGREWVEGDKKTVGAGILLLLASVFSYRIWSSMGLVLFLVLYRLLLPSAAWLLMDQCRRGQLKPWMKNGFFLYAIHFILVRGLSKALSLVLPHNGFWALAVYVIVPITAVAAAWGIGEILRRKIPPLWRVLSGGRS